MSKIKRYFIKQRLIGILIIVLSVISVKLTGDGTAALFMLPIGMFTTLTKEMVITDTYFFDNND